MTSTTKTSAASMDNVHETLLNAENHLNVATQIFNNSCLTPCSKITTNNLAVKISYRNANNFTAVSFKPATLKTSNIVAQTTSQPAASKMKYVPPRMPCTV